MEESTKKRNARPEILARARAAMASKHAGLSPRQRGADKTNQALQWVYRWGWSSPRVLELLTGSVRSGLANRLVKAGLLKATKTESGGATKGVPVLILTLTPEGRDAVEKLIQSVDELIDYEHDAFKVNQALLRHDEIAQRATATGLAAGRIAGYVTEDMAATKSAPGTKQFDIVWILPNGHKVGIEVELSAKWERKLDQFVLSCIQALKAAKVDRIHIVTDSPAIQARYRAAFSAGAKLSTWSKNARGFWAFAGNAAVPDCVNGRVLCALMK